MKYNKLLSNYLSSIFQTTNVDVDAATHYYRRCRRPSRVRSNRMDLEILAKGSMNPFDSSAAIEQRQHLDGTATMQPLLKDLDMCDNLRILIWKDGEKRQKERTVGLEP
ncbi:Uncharacterized protein Fot_35754 [Forsythia ovata]|uniref:Uncharacterized protein n=1 Tax=Forsythia ovata TaxID=205694 RepID=A0ABD1SMF6_9LAMI